MSGDDDVRPSRLYLFLQKHWSWLVGAVAVPVLLFVLQYAIEGSHDGESISRASAPRISADSLSQRPSSESDSVTAPSASASRAAPGGDEEVRFGPREITLEISSDVDFDNVPPSQPAGRGEDLYLDSNGDFTGEMDSLAKLGPGASRPSRSECQSKLLTNGMWWQEANPNDQICGRTDQGRIYLLRFLELEDRAYPEEPVMTIELTVWEEAAA